MRAIRLAGYLLVVTMAYYVAGVLIWVLGPPRPPTLLIYALSYGVAMSLWLVAEVAKLRGVRGGGAKRPSHVERIHNMVERWVGGGRGVEATLVEVLRELAVRAVAASTGLTVNDVWSMDVDELRGVCGDRLATLISGGVKKINREDLEGFLRLIEVTAGWE